MSTPTKDSSTSLAVDRTRLAHERTLMAWLRTSASLISFGFTIYKFFEYMKEQGGRQEGRLFSPRRFALMIIGIGVVSLVIAVIKNRQEMQAMRTHYGELPKSMAGIVAGLVGLLGLVCFLAVMLRQ